ncbi:hypothetical protein CHO01_29800 [Cellulomonas hominis]|uniref:Uncharacterized protein n=1 Tax=Cellulomonas hominis TaxID=156981 RepID=A0A511FH14_9CELL|nr:hypothetical protein CHO01_29800 [Cellulomonas hominis]
MAVLHGQPREGAADVAGADESDRGHARRNRVRGVVVPAAHAVGEIRWPAPRGGRTVEEHGKEVVRDMKSFRTREVTVR